MFENLMKKIKGSKNSTADTQENPSDSQTENNPKSKKTKTESAKNNQFLIDAAQILKVGDSELNQAFIEYVSEGTNPTALSYFQKQASLGVDQLSLNLLLGNPGSRWSSYYHSEYSSEELTKIIQKAVPGWNTSSANAALVALLANPANLAPEQWLRLSKVLKAAARNQSSKFSSAVPDWLPVFDATRRRTSNNEAKIKIVRGDWKASDLVQILQADGLDAEQSTVAFITYYFENETGGDYYPITEVTPFLLENIELLKSTAKNLNVTGKLSLLSTVNDSEELNSQLLELLEQFTLDSSKQVREKALSILTGFPAEVRSKLLTTALEKSTGTAVGAVIDHLARQGDAEGKAVLEAALESSKTAKKTELIKAALLRFEISANSQESVIELPKAETLKDTELPSDFVEQLQAGIDSFIKYKKESIVDYKASDSRFRDENIKGAKNDIASAEAVSKTDLEDFKAFLEGKREKPGKNHNFLSNYGTVLKNIKGLSLLQALRLQLSEKNQDAPVFRSYYVSRFTNLDVDLRLLHQGLEKLGFKTPYESVADLAFGWNGLSEISPENLWPFFAENPNRIDQNLGLLPNDKLNSYGEIDRVRTSLLILDMFPTLPTKYVPRLTELALGEGKTHRQLAQEILEKQENGLTIALSGLENSKAEVRISAAAWLARLGKPEAIEVLETALKKEKREEVQAALLSALQKLGGDISSYLSPETLLAAAQQGLKAKKPAGMEWIPLAALPKANWAKDGKAVDPAILEWWVVLAVKLKDPSGLGLLPIYVSQLDKSSQEKLGTFILDSWIAQDTLHPSEEECREFATAQVDARYNSYQANAKKWPQYYAELGKKSKDQVFEELRREKSSEYLGSAIKEKGMLALSSGAPGHYFLQTVQRYIKDNHQRRSQIEALIIAASTNDDPAAIQLVLSIARRFKQKSVQETASALTEQIAERKGWSLEQLADKTIQTAGFDDDGLLRLDYGSRTFLGKIALQTKTGNYQIELSNPDGKTITSLPAAAVADDEELVKEAKKQLTTAKKELKQITEMQSSRLYEAMCIQRTWLAQDWLENLYQHPVMKQLISALVWFEAEDVDSALSSGSNRKLFRPTPEGELLNLNDETVTLNPNSVVGLVHGSILSPEEISAWKKNLKDYEITPLFEQFNQLDSAFDLNSTAVKDFSGWVSDSFAIRGRATKLGYQRGQAEDAGWFYSYNKDFTGIGLRVLINFSGSFVPEEQIAAAVTDLTFEKSTRGRYKEVTLAEVPPILLAESYSDYRKIAEGGAYAEDWETKVQY